MKVSSLFSKYATLLKPPQKSVEKEVCRVVEELVPFPVRVEYFAYTPSTRAIYIKAPAALRSEILLRREEILSAIKDRLGTNESPTTLL